MENSTEGIKLLSSNHPLYRTPKGTQPSDTRYPVLLKEQEIWIFLWNENTAASSLLGKKQYWFYTMSSRKHHEEKQNKSSGPPPVQASLHP